MAQIDIGDAAMAGVRLTMRKPLVVLTWGALVMAFIALLLVIFGGGVVAIIQAVARSGSAGPGPEQILGLVGGLIGLGLLLWIGLWVINCTIMAAAMRAELEPQYQGFAYLRFGQQELWLMGVTFVMGIVIYLFQLAISIPVVIVEGVVGAGSFGAAGAAQAGDFNPAALASAIGVQLLGQVLILCATAWFWLRLCLGPVMSFRERQFRLFESWTMTSGHAWRMFLAMLLVFVMVSVIYVVIWVIGAAAVFAMIAGSPELKDLKTFFKQPPAHWLSVFAPLLVFVFVTGVVVTGVVNAWTWTTVARIYRQLNPDVDVASTFT